MEWELAQAARATQDARVQDIQLLLTAVSAFLGAGVTCAVFGFWLATRFNRVYARMETIRGEMNARIDVKLEALTTKLEAHDRLDRERFEGIKEDLRRQDIAIMRIEMATGTGPYGLGSKREGE